MSEMLTKDEARARVAKGAALLDRKAPGWAGRIDVGIFNIGLCTLCIIGQLYGEFYDDRARRMLGIWSEAQAAKAGFNYLGPGCAVGRRLLQDAWIEAIADRVVSKPEQRKEALCASVS